MMFLFAQNPHHNIVRWIAHLGDKMSDEGDVSVASLPTLPDVHHYWHYTSSTQ